MGITLGVQASRVQQKFLNNIVQENQQSCQSTVSPSNSNQVIIATNTKLNGATIGQINQTQTDASCLITSGMQSSVENILNATLGQTTSSESDILSVFTSQSLFSYSKLKQDVTNNIYQISQASCNASTAPSNANQYIYLSGDSANNAFIGQSNTTNATSSCSMTNFMKVNTFAQGQGDTNQNSKIVGTLGSIGGVILVLVLGAVIVIALFLLLHIGSKKKTPDTCKLDADGIPPVGADGLPLPGCAVPEDLIEDPDTSVTIE